jgi:WD repeat-containing protein 81
LSKNQISGSAGLSFLIFIEFPSFDGLHPCGCVRHPNILLLLGVLKARGCCYLLQPKFFYTLENIMYYSFEAIYSDWHNRLLIYQIISALAYLHDVEVYQLSWQPEAIKHPDVRFLMALPEHK